MQDFGSSLMRFQRLSHRISEAGERNAAVRRFGIAAAVLSINFFLRAQEESGPGQIEIEIKNLQIDAAHVGQPNQHKFAGQFANG